MDANILQKYNRKKNCDDPIYLKEKSTDLLPSLGYFLSSVIGSNDFRKTFLGVIGIKKWDGVLERNSVSFIFITYILNKKTWSLGASKKIDWLPFSQTARPFFC